uniref:Ig-like domain-containing protein n=1 Tax=Mastacembelus armatus TaxID=205130 RepID=A0A3Q3LU31_9TELE
MQIQFLLAPVTQFSRDQCEVTPGPSNLCALCLFLCSLGQIDIPAEPGQNVTLPCRAPSSSEILVVEWTRPGLDPDFVILYRDSQSDPENQHPSFKERVEDKSSMKDGDVSVIVRNNVTFNDTGTYKCRVFQRPIIYMDVDKTEKVTQEEGSYGLVGLAVGLTVFVALFVSVIVFLKRWKPVPTSYQRAPEEPEPKVSNVSV